MVVLNSFTHDARVLREATALREDGYRVTVICLRQGDLSGKETIDGVEVRRVRLLTRSLPRLTLARLVKYVELVFKTVRIASSLRPAVVHAHDLGALPVGYLIKRFTGAKLVYDAHELESDHAVPEARPPAWFRWSARIVEHFGIRRSDAVITVSGGIADELARQDGIARPVVVRNVAQTIKTTSPAVDLRRMLHFPPDSKILLFQGAIARERGVWSVINALPYLNDVVSVVFLGRSSPETQHDLSAKASALGVAIRVRFLEEVPPDQLLSYTRGADLGLEPTLGSTKNSRYALPNKLFEYIAAGLPVAVSNLPEKRKIVEEYGIGACFEPNDPEDLARAVQSILSPPATYTRIRRSVAKARESLNWDREKGRLLDLYERLS